MIFLFILIGLSLLALLLILPALLRNPDNPSGADSNTNLNATRQQLQALKSDAEQGLISTQEFKRIELETQTTLALELAGLSEITQPLRSKLFFNISTFFIALLVPGIAMLVYLSVGSPQALSPPTPVANQSLPPIEDMVVQLKQRLEKNPGDTQGWFVLGKTYMLMKRYTLAADTFAQLYQLEDKDPDIIANYADALAMVNQGEFNEEVLKLIKQALAIKPDHAQSLWLSGMAALKQNQSLKAIGLFKRAKLSVTDPNSIAELDRLIAVTQAGNREPTKALSNVSITVNVSLDQTIQGLTQANDSVYIFAKAFDGPSAPLAVVKHKVSQLPLSIVLTDEMAMLPNLRLSFFDQVTIQARISKSGQAITKKGDLESQIITVRPTTRDTISLSVSQVVN